PGISPLSLHDALPIWGLCAPVRAPRREVDDRDELLALHGVAQVNACAVLQSLERPVLVFNRLLKERRVLVPVAAAPRDARRGGRDRKSTRLNSSHRTI